MGGAEGGFRLDVHVHGGRGRSGEPKVVHSAGDRRPALCEPALVLACAVSTAPLRQAGDARIVLVRK
jgi:hypothetical protein